MLDYNRSDPLQYGFRKLSSCKTELIEFIDDFFKNLENGKQTDILIMDFFLVI